MSTEPLEEEGTTAMVVCPEPASRLAELHAAYADAKAQADEAASRLKAITDGIKAELTAAAPEEQKVELHSDAGPALRLAYSERWTFDSKKLKADDPYLYVKYARKGGSWSLRVVSGGEQ